MVHILMLLLAAFTLKSVNYLRHSVSLKLCLKFDKSLLSKENVVDFGILPNIWRLTVPQMIVQFGRRSVKMWTKTFFKRFFKNILLYMNGRLSKIRSVHTYAMPRTVCFGWICTSIKLKHIFKQPNFWRVPVQCDMKFEMVGAYLFFPIWDI